MRYELTDRAWSAIRPMLPNKPRGVPRVDDRRFSTAYSGSCDQVRRGAICQRATDPIPPATIASFAGGEQASGIRSWMRWQSLTMRRYR